MVIRPMTSLQWFHGTELDTNLSKNNVSLYCHLSLTCFTLLLTRFDEFIYHVLN